MAAMCASASTARVAGDGQWQVAVPIRSRKDWQGNFKVDGKGFGSGGGSQISGTSVAGWTIAWLSAGDVDGCARGRALSLTLAGRITFSVSREPPRRSSRWRNAASARAWWLLHEPRSSSLPRRPPPAQPAVTQAAVTYGKVGDWTVEFVPARPSAGIQAQCRVTKLYGTENALRRVFGDKLTTIDFMGFGSHARGRSFDVTYRLNNDHAGGGRATMVADNDGVDWIRIDESEDGPGSIEGFQNSRSVTILAKTGGGRWDYALAGMKPAIDMAIKCLHERVLTRPPRRRRNARSRRRRQRRASRSPRRLRPSSAVLRPASRSTSTPKARTCRASASMSRVGSYARARRSCCGNVISRRRNVSGSIRTWALCSSRRQKTSASMATGTSNCDWSIAPPRATSGATTRAATRSVRTRARAGTFAPETLRTISVSGRK